MRTDFSLLTAPSLTGGWLGRFRAQQSGAMSIFAVAASMIMLVFGGIGIDMMYTELQRNRVQNTLDRAVLAAASLENALPPQTVVESYFNAMGMGDALDGVQVANSGASGREVVATASETLPANFLRLLGIENLRAEGLAAAENGSNNIEISLVLDVSGSMAGDKIEQLRRAAKSFVSQVLAENDGTVSVSVVPYNATVNIGPDLQAYLNLEDLHDLSHCAVFDDAAFDTIAITPDQLLEQLGQFDPRSTSPISGDAPYSWCRRGQEAAILPHSTDVTALHAHIDAFEAWGNTAIDLGMKWGSALLDPAMAPAISAMAADGRVDPAVAARPAALSDVETMKYVVLMTDGQNTTQYDLPQDIKRGNRRTGVWVFDNETIDPVDDTYSVLVADNAGTDNDVYFWTRFWNDTTRRYQTTIDGANHPARPAYELTWNDVYDRFGTQAAASVLFGQPRRDGYISWGDYNAIRRPYEPIVTDDQADARLSEVCGVARDQGIVVYTVGVEAPARGLAAMQDCASSPAHYFDVDGDALEQTFAAIARTMTKLRLTQ